MDRKDPRLPIKRGQRYICLMKESQRGEPVGNRSEQDFLTQPGGSVSSSAHLNSLPLSQGFDVTHWGLSEEAAIFTIELADTFVSDLKGHC
jgi:hypothetical protein